MLAPGAALAGAGGEGQQRDVPGSLNRHGQRPLVPGAGAQLPARLDLAPLREVAAQARNVLVVNDLHVVHAERADLATRHIAATAAPARSPGSATAAARAFTGPLGPGAKARSRLFPTALMPWISEKNPK